MCSQTAAVSVLVLALLGAGPAEAPQLFRDFPLFPPEAIASLDPSSERVRVEVPAMTSATSWLFQEATKRGWRVAGNTFGRRRGQVVELVQVRFEGQSTIIYDFQSLSAVTFDARGMPLCLGPVVKADQVLCDETLDVYRLHHEAAIASGWDRIEPHFPNAPETLYRRGKEHALVSSRWVGKRVQRTIRYIDAAEAQARQREAERRRDALLKAVRERFDAQ